MTKRWFVPVGSDLGFLLNINGLGHAERPRSAAWSNSLAHFLDHTPIESRRRNLLAYVFPLPFCAFPCLPQPLWNPATEHAESRESG
jgi:hypothetical protein